MSHIFAWDTQNNYFVFTNDMLSSYNRISVGDYLIDCKGNLHVILEMGNHLLTDLQQFTWNEVLYGNVLVNYMPSNIKTVFKCQDGTTFENRKDAMVHELKLKKTENLKNLYDSDFNSFYKEFVKHLLRKW